MIASNKGQLYFYFKLWDKVGKSIKNRFYIIVKGAIQMKEVKDCQVKVRITTREKEQILEYCEKHNMTVSEFIRFACFKIFQKEEN